MDGNNPGGLPPEIFEKLLVEYKKSLPGRLDAIRKAIDDLKREGSKQNLGAFRFLVHKMAGNAGTFGFGRVTELCRAWEGRVVQMEETFPNCCMDPPFFNELEAFFKSIEEEFKGHGK